MKKLLLTLVLAIVSSSVMAEWVYIAESEEEVEEAYFVTAYADPDTIRKTGNRVKMWVMEDFKIAKTLETSCQRGIKMNLIAIKNNIETFFTPSILVTWAEVKHSLSTINVVTGIHPIQIGYLQTF